MANTSPKIALITGAGTGIGRAAALALAQSGFSVVLAGRRSEPLEAVALQVKSASGTALAMPADITDEASVRVLFARIESVFGRLDVLFNNAGTNLPAGPMEDVTLAQWRSVMDTNLTGAFLCTQAAFRLMKRQTPSGGRIINNGSISAHVPRPHSAPYTASKHGLTGLTRSTNLDGRRHRIVCGQIDIGNAATALTERMSQGVLQADGSVATEPTIDPDDVARAVVYMAGLPLETNVPFLTVMASQMPYAGRG